MRHLPELRRLGDLDKLDADERGDNKIKAQGTSHPGSEQMISRAAAGHWHGSKMVVVTVLFAGSSCGMP